MHFDLNQEVFENKTKKAVKKQMLVAAMIFIVKIFLMLFFDLVFSKRTICPGTTIRPW